MGSVLSRKVDGKNRTAAQFSSDNLVYCQRNFFLGLMVLGHPSQICLLPIYVSFKKIYIAFLYTSPLSFHRGSSRAADRDKGSHVKQSHIHKCQQLLTPRLHKFPMKLVLYHIPHQLGLVILIYFLMSEFSCPASQLIYKKHFFL